MIVVLVLSVRCLSEVRLSQRGPGDVSNVSARGRVSDALGLVTIAWGQVRRAPGHECGQSPAVRGGARAD